MRREASELRELLPDQKPAFVRLVNAKLVVVWDGGIATRDATQPMTIASLAADFESVPESFTRADLIGFDITER
jgi:hypothetical protein